MSELESLGLDPEIIQEFVEETLLGLDALQQTLLRLPEEGRPGLDAIFRWVHTVKGTSGFLSLNELQNFAHKYENFLQNLKGDSSPSLPHETLSLVSEGVDLINDALQNLKTGVVSLTPIYADFLERLLAEDGDDEQTNRQKVEEFAAKLEQFAQKLRQGSDGFAQKGLPSTMLEASSLMERELEQLQNFRVQVVIKTLTLASVRINEAEYLPDVLAILNGLEEVIVMGSRARSLNNPEVAEASQRIHELLYPQSDSERFQWSLLGDLMELMPEVLPNFWRAFWTEGLEQQAQLEFAELDLLGNTEESSAPSPHPKEEKQEETGRKAEETIRIAADYLDQFTRRAEALVMNRNYLENLKVEIEHYLPKDVSKELQDGIGELEKSVGSLQKSLFSIRSTRLSELFEKIPRMIRQLERDLDKSVKLQIEGDRLEVDRSVVAVLSDPLVHLVRNAIDHGLESPDQRKRMGKPEQGLLAFHASKTEDSLILRVSDDGKGIDPDRVLRKALEKGLADSATEYSTSAIYDMLLLPGFSTVEQVTNVSGRGVGLDVVRSALVQQGGDVRIHSTLGEGTTFELTFPLRQGTLTRNVLLVRIGTQRYALNHTHLREVVEEGKVSLSNQGAETFFCHRDQLIPLLDLGKVLNQTQFSDPSKGRFLIVEDEQNRTVALRVDQTLHPMQVVIKPFEHAFLKQNLLFAGTIVTGLGQPVLVLSLQDVSPFL